MEPEFNCLDKLITGVDINTAAARDHVLEIERHIQTIKEHMNAVHGGLPYDCMTSWMVIEIVKNVLMMLNTFSPKRGIS